ncbi:hypothetical protein LguiA_030275 [Lonicera macranthoides]
MALTSKSSFEGLDSRLYIKKDVIEVVNRRYNTHSMLCGMGGVGNKTLERSKINKQNRAPQTIVHTTGSKGFHCLEYEMTQEIGEHPKMKSFWKITRTRKKKDGADGEGWVSKEAKKLLCMTSHSS